jgi:hypothetical protein
MLTHAQTLSRRCFFSSVYAATSIGKLEPKNFRDTTD